MSDLGIKHPFLKINNLDQNINEENMNIALPDGTRVNVPDNATDEQINEFLNRQFLDSQLGFQSRGSNQVANQQGGNQSNDKINAVANGREFTFPAGTTQDQMGEVIDEFFATQPNQNQSTGLDFDSLVPFPRESGATGSTGLDFDSLIPDSLAQQQSTDNQTALPEFGTVDGNSALFGSQFGDESTGFGQILRDAGAGLFTLSGSARVDGIEQRFPELQIDRFDDGSNAFVTNPRTGAQTVVNAKGLSNSDIAPIVGGTLASLPAGRLVQGLSGGAKVAGVGAGAVATDAVLQGAEIAQGSEQGIDKARLITSGLFASGFQGATNAVISKLNNKQTRQLVDEVAPSIETLKGRASDAYNEIDQLGVTLKPSAVGSLVDRLSAVAQREGFEPQIHKQTSVALNTVLDRAQNSGELPIGELDRLRRVFRAASKNINQPDDSRLSTLMIRQIDDVLDNLPESAITGGDGSRVGAMYRTARDNYHRANKAETLDVAIQLGLEAQSGQISGIRSEFAKLSRKLTSGKLKGYTAAEKEAIKAVVTNKPTSANILRLVGSFGISTNSGAFNLLLGSVGAGAAGSVGGIPATLAQQAASLGAQRLAGRLILNDAKFASSVTRLGNDGLGAFRAYTEAVPRSLQSADELAEIINHGNLNVDRLSQIVSKQRGNKRTRELITDTLNLVGSTQTSAAINE